MKVVERSGCKVQCVAQKMTVGRKKLSKGGCQRWKTMQGLKSLKLCIAIPPSCGLLFLVNCLSEDTRVVELFFMYLGKE